MVIRAARAQDERGKSGELGGVLEPEFGAVAQIDMRNSQIEKFLGPPGFEPGTKGL